MAGGSARGAEGYVLASAVSRRKVAVAARFVSLCKASVGVGIGVVVVGVGNEREGEACCARCISGEGVEPAHHPDAERKGIVDPVFGVVVFFLAGRWCMS